MLANLLVPHDLNSPGRVATRKNLTEFKAKQLRETVPFNDSPSVSICMVQIKRRLAFGQQELVDVCFPMLSELFLPHVCPPCSRQILQVKTSAERSTAHRRGSALFCIWEVLHFPFSEGLAFGRKSMARQLDGSFMAPFPLANLCVPLQGVWPCCPSRTIHDNSLSL